MLYCYLATDAEWVAAQHLDAMEDVAVEFYGCKGCAEGTAERHI